MAVPSSPSSITMKGLHNEMTSNNYPSATNPPGAVTMKDLAESGNSGGSATSYAAINTNAPSRPDTNTPHAIGEWYGYDHDFNASVIQPPSNLSYTATSTTQICFCFTEANFSTGVCVFFGSFGSLSGQSFQPDGQSVITVDGSGDSGWMAGPPTNDNHAQGIISLSANDCLQIFYKSCANNNPFGTGNQTSAASACITGYTQPGIPGSLSTTSITTSGMTIGWSAPTGGVNSTNGYRYYHGTGTTATNNTANDTGNTSIAISGLAQNTRYYWTVKAKGDGGDFGTAASQESPYTLPGVPTGLAAGSVTSTGMTISWTAPSPGGADGYRLYFGNKSPASSNTAYVQSGTSKSFTSLTAGTTYYFAVQASNPDGSYGALTSTVSQATSAGTTIQLRTIASNRTLTTVSSGGTQSHSANVASGNSLTDLADMSDPNGHVQINISNGSGDTTATNGSMASQPPVNHKLTTSSDPDNVTGTGYQPLTTTLNGGTSSQLYYNMRVKNPTVTQAYGGTTTFTNNSVSVTRTFTFNITVSLSDIRLKENIKLIGHSDSKIPIYEFNFKRDSKKIKWTGAMAQDLLEMGREDAVYISEHGEDKGYYGVYYDKIDVDLLSENLISEKVM